MELLLQVIAHQKFSQFKLLPCCKVSGGEIEYEKMMETNSFINAVKQIADIV